MMNLDFSNVPSREPLAEGIYALQIAKAEEKIASTGTPMLTLEYDVMEVEGNRKLWENYPLIDSALWKIQELCKAIGIDASGVVSLEPQDLVGQVVNAKVVQDTYNGEVVNRVKKVMVAG